MKPLEKAFVGLGVSARVVSAAQAKIALNDTAVLYVTQEALTDELRTACEKAKVLTIAGFVDLAVKGRVSIGFGLTDKGKPELVVNLQRLAAEGHTISSRALRTVRVIH